MTVGELLHGRGTPMSSSEFEEWKAYFKIVASEMKDRHPDNGVQNLAD